MRAVRHLIAQRRLALLLCAATLILKLLVPTGYMIGSDHGRLAITVCTGMAPAGMAMAPMEPMAMPAMHGHGHGHGHGTPDDHGKAEQPCAFAGLSAAMTGAIDPVRLAELIAFVMATGVAAMLLPTPAGPSYLRPPLRGPPAYR